MSLIAAEATVGYALKKQPMTAGEFLAWDAGQSIRHEFVRGEVFAMAGAGERHVIATGNLLTALRVHLRGTPCRVLGTDMKLRIEAADCYYYPDLMVTCSPSLPGNQLEKSDARLVVEVLSPSTAAYDRGDKFANYRQLPSLQEYLLVDVDAMRCDLFRKGADGLWVLHPTGPDETVQLASVDLRITAVELWADLEPPAAPAESAA